MNTLFLVRHGEAVSPSEDPEQPLSQIGVRATERVAFLLKHARPPIELILHSSKLRTKQTAEILRQILVPHATLQEIQGMQPLDSVESFFNTISSEEQAIMIVGHLPFLDKLLSLLLFKDESFSFFNFCNSAIACLEKDQNKWTLAWAVSPKLIEE